MDTVWLVGLFVIVISVALVLFASLTSIAIASYQVYQWARRGRIEMERDLQEVTRLREAVNAEAAR